VIAGAAASLFSGLTASLLFVVLATALLHRVFWPHLRDLIENIYQRRLTEVDGANSNGGSIVMTTTNHDAAP
jgi:hypothetical protein